MTTPETKPGSSIVIALGGNAILRPGQQVTFEEQLYDVDASARGIAQLVSGTMPIPATPAVACTTSVRLQSTAVPPASTKPTIALAPVATAVLVGTALQRFREQPPGEQGGRTRHTRRHERRAARGGRLLSHARLHAP